MNQTKSRKSPDKNGHSSAPARHREREQTVDILIRGLDMLALYAEGSDMGTAARIFYTAKEELVHWAVTMNFHESAQDLFINQRLYDTRLAGVETIIIRAIKDSGLCDDMLGLLGILPGEPLAARK